LWLVALYQAATLLTVIQNPYQANIIEWFHAGVLVAGGLLVGWAVGRSGHVKWGLGLLLVAGLVFAVLHILQAGAQYFEGNFSPIYLAWPYPTHKNAAGTILAILALVAYLRPPWLGWSRRSALVAFWVLVVGLGTTQSRQAIIGLGVALAVLVMRRTTGRARSKGILLALIPALAGVSIMVQDQVQSGNEFNSVFQRLSWFQDSLDIWATDPWLGVGLRWWYTDRFAVNFQPPNAEIDTLTSAGVLGLVTFLALIIGTWLIARRVDPIYGIVAELVLLLRFVQSQFDLFWVSVQVTLPFLVLGLCLGALAHRDAVESSKNRIADTVRSASGSDRAVA
jgi:O-antigen ligase